MEVIELPRMAEALSCQPRTLCRLIHGPFAARSLRKAPVSLEVAALSLKTEQQALSLFIESALAGKDEALDPEWAVIVSGLPKSTFYRHHKEGAIPAIVHVGRFSRFSREAIKQALKTIG